MIKKVICIFLAILFISSLNIYASGVPVVDVVAALRWLSDRQTELKKLEQLTNGTEFSKNQLKVLSDEFSIKLKEYRSFLQQIRSVEHLLSEKDWYRLALASKRYYGRYKGRILTTMDMDSNNYEEDRDDLLSEYGHVPRHPDEVDADTQDYSEKYQSEVEKDYIKYNELKDKMDMVANNATQSEKRKERIKAYANQVENLGDESDLATMQTMAMQNVTLMKQLEHLIEIQNQQLLFQRMQDAENAALRAKQRELELKRLKNRQPTELFGDDRWGSL